MTVQRAQLKQAVNLDANPGARFRRLAEKRVVRTIKDIRLIGNLSNRNNYGYTEEEVEKIFKVIEKELKQARAKFDNRSKSASGIEFKL